MIPPQITRDELQQIRKRVWPLVIQFCIEHNDFYSRELDEYVEAQAGKLANETATRCLRELRQQGYLDYWVDSEHRFHMRRKPCADTQLVFDYTAEDTNDKENVDAN